MLRILFLFIFIFLFKSPKLTYESRNENKFTHLSTHTDFKKYWFSGEAEVSTYDLEQARYGELHEGHATLIFVTEPFSPSKQVKLDNPNTPGAINVMKLNAVRKFNTGLYPYSIMSSSFQPLNFHKPAPLVKATFSSQEWCGQTFMQINNKYERDYNIRYFSYFESEGDQSTILKDVFLEDEIWTQIRIEPKHLPKGEIFLLPSMQELRLKHMAIQTQRATAELTQLENNEMLYVVDYKDIERTLRIHFENEFPYRILSWTEKVQSGFGRDKQIISTTATLKQQEKLKYWELNGVADRKRRRQLGLPENSQ